MRGDGWFVTLTYHATPFPGWFATSEDFVAGIYSEIATEDGDPEVRVSEHTL